MKYFILFLLFGIFSCSAQSSLDLPNGKPGLSEDEMNALKESYRNMLASDLYLIKHKHSRAIAAKRNGLDFPTYPQDKNWLSNDEYTKKWLESNISKTKFSSTDEAYSMLQELVKLTQRVIDENPEVYQPLAKANKEQMKEIFDLEVQYKLKYLKE